MRIVTQLHGERLANNPNVRGTLMDRHRYQDYQIEFTTRLTLLPSMQTPGPVLVSSSFGSAHNRGYSIITERGTGDESGPIARIGIH